MINIQDKKTCSGCYSCVNICPKQCIEMKCDFEGFWYPEVDKSKCINCNLCIKHCPIQNNINVLNNPIAYACNNLDDEIRKSSSSGGIFTLLAEYVLDKGGIVYGAAFDSSYMVHHIKVDDKKELNLLRGSKYLQSRIGNIYKEIKENLNKNILVYFSGTPCQIDGLKIYLNKEYNNLICQDIICHGVPSPKIWQKYLGEKNKENGGILPTRINFRQKDSGWNLYELSISYNTDSSYKCCHREDPYMKAFLSNLSLRPSCYKCHSKSLHRQSDITLADFWGIENIYNEINDNKGTSLVFINSEKGLKLYDAVKYKMKYKRVDINEAVKYNQSVYKSVNQPNRRTEFLNDIFKNDFYLTVKKHTKISFKDKIKYYLKL